MTADDVSRSARGLGLAWSRSTVAALERGDKSVSAEELLLLPMMLSTGSSKSERTSLVDLLPTGDEWIRLTPKSRLKADALQRIARGQGLTLGQMDTPAYSVEAGQAASRNTARTGRRIGRVWPGATLDDLGRAQTDAMRDAEQGVARKLGIDARDVSIAAHATFGRGLTEERDHRVGDGGSAQKRGRVTRQLTDEIKPKLDEYRKGSHGKH